MSDQIMIGSCPECGHFPSQLVGDAESLDYVIHLPEKDYGCQAGPHKRIHQLESQLEQERARVAELENVINSQSRNNRELQRVLNKKATQNLSYTLRKQAEAVEHQVKIERDHFDSYAPCLTRMQNRAQWLRNQAEKAGGNDGSDGHEA